MLQHFVAKINVEDDDEEDEVPVNLPWIKENFQPAAVYAIMHDCLHNGYAPVSGLNISKEKRQIAGIRCISKDSEGEAIQQKWKCLYVDKPNKPQDVSFGWLKNNFSVPFLKECRERSERPGFVAVPPGRAKSYKNDTLETAKGAPVVFYQQGKDPYCLHYSFASALHYVKLHKVAKLVSELAPKNASKIDSWKCILECMKKNVPWLQCSRFGEGKLDIYGDISRFPTLAILQGDDGSIDHAVTTIGHWLFDSNRKICPMNQSKNIRLVCFEH